MTQISDLRWGEYRLLQRVLDSRRIVDDVSGGLEAALDALVSAASSPVFTEDQAELATRSRASEMRRRRRRRGLLAREEGHVVDLARADADRPADTAAHARIELARIVRICNDSERALVVALASGSATSSSPSDGAAARKRLQRLRKRLAA